MQTLFAIFNKYSEITLVHLFGSRSKGNYSSGSDIDLAVMNTDIGKKTLMQLSEDFSESSLPYNVDIVHFPTLQNKDLIAHIQRVGVEFYKK